jgi:hypothetical protein
MRTLIAEGVLGEPVHIESFLGTPWPGRSGHASSPIASTGCINFRAS